MADQKISDSASATLTGTEIVPVVQSGVNKRTTAQAIANLKDTSGYALSSALTTEATARASGDTAAIASAVSTIRNSVATEGNDLAKLYALIQTLNSIVTDTAPDGDSFVDTIQELLVVLASYPEGTDLATALNGKINTSASINTLTETSSGKVLDARQGKTLKDLIDALTLNALFDVVISSPSTGQVLKYNGTNWVNDTDSTSGGSTALDDLSDVTLTSPANDDIIQRKSGVFVNRTIAQLKTDLALLAANISDFQATVSANTDVAAMKAIIGTGISDGDSLVDTLAEMLAVFTTYAEGVDIATQLAGKVTANTAITGATKTKITYDAKGLVTNGADLIASDIPALDAAKITTGTLSTSLMPIIQFTATSRILGRKTAGAGDAEELTASDVRTLAGLVIGTDVQGIGADIQLAENKSILMDAALSADGKWSAVVAEAGTLGETVAFGEFVYLKAADSQWYKTDADATATAGAVKVGVCCVAGVDNGSTVIMFIGKIRADSLFPTLTIGAPVFLSTTAGAVTNTAPSGTDDVIRIVGYGNTADEMFVNVSNEYITST